ncbi:DAO domain-containing protein [Mycena sanguinolenta]|uniref:DAO domain-containing protein n=1 Tax=Mycena sanguinolenta TaxID=230812 RepID=A0A8H6YX85_9AGAR|nr:DAO domain-containing protein [Mycena sanguinolenta]
MSSDSVRNIVVVGGGIIGCTTAYYLTRHPAFVPSQVSITLLEASTRGAAQGASGKAGGLVAKWAYPKELVNVSFNEHVKLANEHNGKDRWGWRYVSTGSWEGRGDPLPDDLDARPSNSLKREKSLEKTLGLPDGRKVGSNRKLTGLPDDLLWVKEHLTQSYSSMAPEGATAQVHPYLFTTSMLDLAKEKGAQFKSGTVTSIIQSGGKVTGVKYVEAGQSESQTLPATDVVVCGGAWSPALISRLPIQGMRAHSVVIRTEATAIIAPYVLFTEITGLGNGVVTPEIYARPDGTVYACGPGDYSPLPDNVDDVVVDPTACENLLKNVCAISDELRAGTTEVRQACYLPVSSIGGGPIIGEAEKIAKGLFVATGHTCWGISNAPGTAKAMAELVMEGHMKCADLKRLHPSKFI